ncbi:putative ATP-binding cassette transporter/putative ATP-binding cassette transporter [Luteibacter rhizovicinus]|uniref:Putative ATP-binding cassette transporter/putative ATP-binding cassette transporter n=1 Tax=Luteibacter rhizovicinus TaxID=242606 RepID=A0A4V2W4H8_9GAMM|nr:cyclic peptide export ABC transporter [Luteibacter rhizovicinus]TCV95969.1 putative ATP-binding cassette transporter/putative ATP-binding cassette transporter [Luteibacter rhizovicinus]
MILKRFLRQYRGSLIGAVVLSAASAVSTMALLSHINNLASGGFHALGLRPFAIGVCWLVALLITSAASQFLLANLGGNLVAQLRIELSKKFIDLEYEKLADKKHAVFGSLIEDIASIAPLVLVAPLLAYNILLAILYAGYLASVSFQLLGILLGFLCTTLVVSLTLERLLRSKFDQLRQANEKVFEYFRYISEGKKEMTLNASRASYVTDELMQPAIQRARRIMIHVHAGLGFNEAWSTAVIYGSVFLIVYLGYAALELSQITIIRFVIGALFLSGPIGFIVSAARQVGVGTASLRHLERVGLDLGREAPDNRPADKERRSFDDWQCISLRGVCYSYPGEVESLPTLGPISLDFRRGDMVFIVGGNGSGKSTLLLLLSSLLSPHAGGVSVDGVPLDGDPFLYRERFTGVFGDFFLFPHVLDSNGRHLSDERIQTLLAALGLGSHVQANQGELSKLTLSTGQRKRLALLQCYAEDREIFFFDEWAADQDAHFRDFFYCSLLPELKRRGKTIIAISHDDRYFHVADRVIKLESGLVVSDTRDWSSVGRPTPA